MKLTAEKNGRVFILQWDDTEQNYARYYSVFHAVCKEFFYNEEKSEAKQP